MVGSRRRKLARKRATLGDVARGLDPADERATKRKTLTVAQLCDRYLEAAKAGLVQGKRGLPKKPSTLDTDTGRIERHIKPLLGRKLVVDLCTADLNRFVRDVAGGKTAITAKTVKGRAAVTGGPGTASRTMGFLGGILSFALSEGIIPASPARGVRRPADKSRTRRLTPDEYRLLGVALSRAEDDRETWQAVAGVRLLALTGCRRGEVEALTWAEVDLAGQALRLVDSKEGASVRPIGSAAVEVLANLPRNGGGYVLPPVRRAERYRGLAAAVERYSKRAGLAGVTAHVLRHSYASTAGDLGYSEPTIAALIGHAKGSVTSRYIHQLDTVLIASADKVAGQISVELQKCVA